MDMKISFPGGKKVYAEYNGFTHKGRTARLRRSNFFWLRSAHARVFTFFPSASSAASMLRASKSARLWSKTPRPTSLLW
jgi:hypothetical protein